MRGDGDRPAGGLTRALSGGDGDRPAGGLTRALSGGGLTRALSWLNVSTLSSQTRRLFRSQSELRPQPGAGRRVARSQSQSRLHTPRHAVGTGGRRGGQGDSDDNDDDWVYEPQHRTGERETYSR
jgi:hypothetical protein